MTNTMSAADAQRQQATAEAGIVNLGTEIAHLRRRRANGAKGLGVEITGLEHDLKDAKEAAAQWEKIANEAVAAIDSTEDDSSEVVAEFLDCNRDALGLGNAVITRRKRPGKAMPKNFPEICVSQQENGHNSATGIPSVKRLFITVYAKDAASLPKIDSRAFKTAVERRGRPFKTNGLGNNNPIEQLDGGVRCTYVVDHFTGHLRTPKITNATTTGIAESVGRKLAEAAKGYGPVVAAQVKAGSGKVLTGAGKRRAVEVTVEVFTERGTDAATIGDRVSFSSVVDTVKENFGRIESAEIVGRTGFVNGAELTVRVEAATA